MKAVIEAAARIGIWWADNRPFSEEARARRKARRDARKDKKAAVDEVAEEFNSLDDGGSMNPFPQGTQTLSGIAVLVLVPWLAKYGIDSEQVQAIVAAAGTLIGTVVAVAGYLRRKKLPAE